MPTQVIEPRDAIAAYLRAKDENRPHFMTQAFAETATLDMVVRAEGISFPPHTAGREAVSDVLVRGFAQRYENVRTFCLADPPAAACERFACAWLVAMSEKATRAVRVGCGTYDWRFDAHGRGLVARLTIAIEMMASLAPHRLQAVMTWSFGLPYPWCPPHAALEAMPVLAELAAIRRWLTQRLDTSL